MYGNAHIVGASVRIIVLKVHVSLRSWREQFRNFRSAFEHGTIHTEITYATSGTSIRHPRRRHVVAVLIDEHVASVVGRNVLTQVDAIGPIDEGAVRRRSVGCVALVVTEAIGDPKAVAIGINTVLCCDETGRGVRNYDGMIVGKKRAVTLEEI